MLKKFKQLFPYAVDHILLGLFIQVIVALTFLLFSSTPYHWFIGASVASVFYIALEIYEHYYLKLPHTHYWGELDHVGWLPVTIATFGLAFLIYLSF